MTSASSVQSEDRIDLTETDTPDDNYLRMQEEIWRIVSEAAETETSLSLGDGVRRIESAFPDRDCQEQAIRDALVFAAVDLGATITVASAPAKKRRTVRIGTSLLARARRGKRNSAAQQGAPAAEPIQAMA